MYQGGCGELSLWGAKSSQLDGTQKCRLVHLKLNFQVRKLPTATLCMWDYKIKSVNKKIKNVQAPLTPKSFERSILEKNVDPHYFSI